MTKFFNQNASHML